MAKTSFTRVSGGDGSKVAFETPQPTTTNIPTITSDNSISLQITSFKLNGRNFLQWSRSIQLVIRSKGKFGYLDGSIPQPASTDPSYSTWDIHNSMFMTWLIHYMKDNIGEVYLLYPTVKAIWDVVSLAYSNLTDSSQMFFLRNRARNLRQDDVTQYFSALRKLWQELNLFNQVEWSNKSDVELFRRMLAKARVYDFLASLNSSLHEVRGHIFGMKPLPVIDEVFAEVYHEEHCKQIMLSQQPSSFPLKPVALVSNDARNKKGSRWCEHCQRPNHTKATC